MKFQLKHIASLAFVFLFLYVLVSCGQAKQSEGDGNDKAVETKAGTSTTEEHDDDENISMLTEEQIRTAGISLGDIEQKQLTDVIKVNGRLRVPNTNKANATSLFGGVIKSLQVELGDYVRKGQTIATISNPQFIQLQEEYFTIGPRIVYAEQELQRQQALNEGNVGAMKNLQNATAELNTLRTRRSSLRQQIQLMGINPNAVSNDNLRSTLSVTSPISGTVSNVFATMGSYVDVSAPLFEIVDNSAAQLDLQVFEKDLPQIKLGQKIDFQVTNNPANNYIGEVLTIGSAFTGDSKNVSVICRIIGNKQGLIDGMNVTGLVNMSGERIAAVPNDALVNADGRYYIFVLDDKPEKPHVHVEGEAHNDEGKRFKRIEVMKGVTELGYTAITPITEVPKNAKIVVKGAFFVNASLNTAENEHAH